MTKFSNAYMLVYIRESDKNKIMCNVDEKDIAEEIKLKVAFFYSLIHYVLLRVFDVFLQSLEYLMKSIQLGIKEKQEEQKRKERVKAHPYTQIKVSF